MPKVTRVLPQKKKGFFNVFIDGRFAFGLDEEFLIKGKIVEEKVLTEEDVNRLKEASLYSKLLNSALKFLSYRPRSKKEMERNLSRKVYKVLGSSDKELALKLSDQVVSKIESWGYLNDEDFAKWLIEQRRRGRNPKGPSFIKKELMLKGISREMVNRLMRELEIAISDEDLIRLLTKKERSLKDRDLFERKRKLQEFLLRRGFDYNDAKEMVARYYRKL